MSRPGAIPTTALSAGPERRSRTAGMLLTLWITFAEGLAALLTFLFGFTLGLLIPPTPDDPNPAFSYLDYVWGAVLAAPVTAAIAAVVLARQMRLGSPLLYALPVVVPVLIAMLLHGATDTWFLQLVLLLPLGNILLGAIAPRRP